MTQLFILEDNPLQLAALKAVLGRQGYGLTTRETLADLSADLRSINVDLFLLDWSLPDGTSETLITRIRQELGWQIPILILSVTDDEEIITLALRLGADDYIVKPFNESILLARIHAQLRRAQRLADALLSVGDYVLNKPLNRLSLRNTEIQLPDKEFQLASYLLEHVGELVSRARLMEVVWNTRAELDTRTVDVHISRLRKNLRLEEQSALNLVTVHRLGYRMELASPD